MPDEVPEFDESLMPSDEPESVSDIELTEAHWRYARQRWPESSKKMQAYNMRRSIWVRLQHRKPHPDDPGRKALGGAQPNSGRKPTKKIGRALVEAAEARQKELLDATFAPLAPGNDPMDRHKAAMNIYKHDREERKEERDADDYARRTDEEVKREFAHMIAEMVRNGEISMAELQGYIDGTAEEVDPAQEIEAA